jgi:hypothetical protein
MPLDQNPAMGSTEEIYEISTKTQEVVDEYKNYIGGGFAPYPVRLIFPHYPHYPSFPRPSLN